MSLWKMNEKGQNVPKCADLFPLCCLEANVLPPDDEQEAMADLPGLFMLCFWVPQNLGT